MAKKDRLRARAILDEIDFDPIRHLAAIARAPNTPLDLQIQAARHLLPFAHPRLADFEITVESPDAQPISMNIVNLLADEPATRRAIEDAYIREAQRQRQQSQIEASYTRKSVEAAKPDPSTEEPNR